MVVTHNKAEKAKEYKKVEDGFIEKSRGDNFGEIDM